MGGWSTGVSHKPEIDEGYANTEEETAEFEALRPAGKRTGQIYE